MYLSFLLLSFSAPTPPNNFKLAVDTSKSIRASWDRPLKLNGILRRYVIMYGKARDKLDGTFFTTSTTYLLAPLEEFTEYFVQVYAETAVSGHPSNIERAKTSEDGNMSVVLLFLLYLAICCLLGFVCIFVCFSVNYINPDQFKNSVLHPPTTFQVTGKTYFGGGGYFLLSHNAQYTLW